MTIATLKYMHPPPSHIQQSKNMQMFNTDLTFHNITVHKCYTKGMCRLKTVCCSAKKIHSNEGIRPAGGCGDVPSVPFGVIELLFICELSMLGPFGDSLLPLTRLCGLARSCISIDLRERDTQTVTWYWMTHAHTLKLTRTSRTEMQVFVKNKKLTIT